MFFRIHNIVKRHYSINGTVFKEFKDLGINLTKSSPFGSISQTLTRFIDHTALYIGWCMHY